MSTIPSPVTSSSTVARPVALTGVLVAIVSSALTAYGAHTWAEILITVPIIAVTTGLVFGLVVPRALRKEAAGGVALALSIPAALLLLPAFWAGVPFVLGVGAVIVGNAGRSARSGAGTCIAGLVLGALVSVGYLAIYVAELAAGNAGGVLFN